jgi:hypothetical protein
MKREIKLEAADCKRSQLSARQILYRVSGKMKRPAVKAVK